MGINANKSGVIQQIFKSEPQLSSLLRPGDLAQGAVLKKESKQLFVDLGPAGTGVIYGREFVNAKNVIKELKVGDSVSAKVIEADNENGYIELSLSEADKQKVWETLREMKEKDEVLETKISACNRGGLIAEIKGLPAFIPVSQLSNDHYPRVSEGDRSQILAELKKLVGSSLKTKILDLNPRTNKLILSEREALQTNIREFLNQYQVGQVIDGIIVGVADFGAFVRFTDNPAVEGLIHISELDHRLIDNPKEVVKVDEAVKAQIIEIKDGRISLSLKALKPDPWTKVEERFKAGEAVKGTVYKFNPFGAFINLDGQIFGLIHVSEFGSVDEMKNKLTVNGEYEFVIESVKPLEKRLLLKLKK